VEGKNPHGGHGYVCEGDTARVRVRRVSHSHFVPISCSLLLNPFAGGHSSTNCAGVLDYSLVKQKGLMGVGHDHPLLHMTLHYTFMRFALRGLLFSHVNIIQI
jgi:hypothetical protein